MSEHCGTFFVFECYADGNFLFRSVSSLSATLDPSPLEPEHRKVQSSLKREGKRLTYAYIATGLSKHEALMWLCKEEKNAAEGGEGVRNTETSCLSTSSGRLNSSPSCTTPRPREQIAFFSGAPGAKSSGEGEKEAIDWSPNSGITRFGIGKRGRLV